jgi:excisionase family DNA binding protein
MATIIDREQETLWDTVKFFIQRKDEDTAKVILKTTIEKSLKLMDISTPFIAYLNFKIPEEEYLEKLKQMDAQIRQDMAHSSSPATFEKVLDYLEMISDITDNSSVSYKKMVASILARKSKKWVRFPRSISAVAPFVEVEVLRGESSNEYVDPIQEMLRQQLAEDKKEIRASEKTYYTTSEAAKKLGLSDQTIRRMCESGRFKRAHRSCGENGHWRIPEENFITTREQDQKAEEILEHLDQKNKEAGDVDEFDL